MHISCRRRVRLGLAVAGGRVFRRIAARKCSSPTFRPPRALDFALRCGAFSVARERAEAKPQVGEAPVCGGACGAPADIAENCIFVPQFRGKCDLSSRLGSPPPRLVHDSRPAARNLHQSPQAGAHRKPAEPADAAGRLPAPLGDLWRFRKANVLVDEEWPEGSMSIPVHRPLTAAFPPSTTPLRSPRRRRRSAARALAAREHCCNASKTTMAARPYVPPRSRASSGAGRTIGAPAGSPSRAAAGGLTARPSPTKRGHHGTDPGG